MTHPLAATVIDLGSNPLLAFLLSLCTPAGAGWLVGAVVTTRWLLKDDRWRRYSTAAAAWLRRGRTIARLEPTLAGIQADVAGVRQSVADHLAESELIKTSLGASIERVNARLDVVIALSQEVRYEVKNNGGGSVKDSTHRIERALGLPEPTSQGHKTGPIATQPAPA